MSTDNADHGYTVAALADDLLAWWHDEDLDHGGDPDYNDVHCWLLDQARQMGAQL